MKYLQLLIALIFSVNCFSQNSEEINPLRLKEDAFEKIFTKVGKFGYDDFGLKEKKSGNIIVEPIYSGGIEFVVSEGWGNGYVLFIDAFNVNESSQRTKSVLYDINGKILTEGYSRIHRYDKKYYFDDNENVIYRTPEGKGEIVIDYILKKPYKEGEYYFTEKIKEIYDFNFKLLEKYKVLDRTHKNLVNPTYKSPVLILTKDN